MEEQEAISRSRAGNTDCFNWLVERYERQVYNLALYMLRNPQDAEDATQDAFLSAFRAVKKFRGSNFKAWLLSIVANACRDRFRATKRHPAISLDSVPLEPQAFESVELPEDYALRQELRRFINEALPFLPEDQRLVVVLCDIQGMSYEEISQVTGSSLGTVKSRLSRGRQKLRDLLLQHGELLPPEFRLNK